ncbi:MAG TPA: metallopeptidase family protein [Syntrophorhabdales bacterium]|nr:metallopeptidase family protein [Syntrophorhabdales bacterium]
MKLSEEEFDRIVRMALDRIPADLSRYLDNLIISVRKRPSRKMLREMNLEIGDALFGLFDGVPLTERSVTSPPLFPDSILLFQEPLEAACETLEQLEEEIEVTIVHEVAHFVGMSEERLTELGYD